MTESKLIFAACGEGSEDGDKLMRSSRFLQDAELLLNDCLLQNVNSHLLFSNFAHHQHIAKTRANFGPGMTQCDMYDTKVNMIPMIFNKEEHVDLSDDLCSIVSSACDH